METANCCEYAYKASPGWDAVSGLGSPNFKLLSSLVLNMDSQFPDLGAYPTASAKTTTMDDSPTTILAVDTNSIAVAGLVFGILAFLLAAYAVCCQKKHNYDAILDTSSRGNRN